MKAIAVAKEVPEWVAHVADDGAIVLEREQVYPLVLGLLELPADQYGVEVARRCATQALLDTLGPGIVVRFVGGRERWALAKLPEGKGAELGARQFRRHYERIKGRLLAAGPSTAGQAHA